MGQEVLTTMEFAKRCKVGRTKVFQWIRDGVLVPGKHFIKVDRIIRFYWRDDILFSLEQPRVKAKAAKNNNRLLPKINLEY